MYSFQLFAVVLYTYLVWERERLMLPSKAPCYYRHAQMVKRETSRVMVICLIHTYTKREQISMARSQCKFDAFVRIYGPANCQVQCRFTRIKMNCCYFCQRPISPSPQRPRKNEGSMARNLWIFKLTATLIWLEYFNTSLRVKTRLKCLEVKMSTFVIRIVRVSAGKNQMCHLKEGMVFLASLFSAL